LVREKFGLFGASLANFSPAENGGFFVIESISSFRVLASVTRERSPDWRIAGMGLSGSAKLV
jgi:hypothetical protein